MPLALVFGALKEAAWGAALFVRHLWKQAAEKTAKTAASIEEEKAEREEEQRLRSQLRGRRPQAPPHSLPHQGRQEGSAAAAAGGGLHPLDLPDSADENPGTSWVVTLRRYRGAAGNKPSE